MHIEISGLSKSFGDNAVFRHIDISFRRGEVSCIIGASGSGKSTFLRCLSLLEHPEEGTVRIGDIEVTMPLVDRRLERSLRRKSSMVFQQYNLFANKTAVDNVALGLIRTKGMSRIDARRRSEELLDRVGLGDQRNQYPITLSGGQQQRVAIARALAIEPEVMLFDEPTSALDPELVAEVLQVIRTIAESGSSPTMLIVTHEMTFAREVADRVVFMDKGEIAEDGSPAEVLTNSTNRRVRQFLRQVHDAQS